jgi:hypothetical protein
LDVSQQDGQIFWRDEDLDAARYAWLASDEAFAFAGEDHLVDGRRGDAEVTAYVGFRRGAAMYARVRIDTVSS